MCRKTRIGIKQFPVSATVEETVETANETELNRTTYHSQIDNQNKSSKIDLTKEENGLCTMDFYGALGKEGVGIGIWIHGPMNQ